MLATVSLLICGATMVTAQDATRTTDVVGASLIGIAVWRLAQAAGLLSPESTSRGG